MSASMAFGRCMTEASGSNGIGSFATLGAVISNVIKPGRLTSVLGKHAWQPRVQSRSLARLQAQVRPSPGGALLVWASSQQCCPIAAAAALSWF